MNHDDAVKINRLDWLSKRARGYSQRAREVGNAMRAFRAANLEVIVENRIMRLICVESYNDFD